jgi:hypothetical protein
MDVLFDDTADLVARYATTPRWSLRIAGVFSGTGENFSLRPDFVKELRVTLVLLGG